jgi:hypothetical protein
MQVEEQSAARRLGRTILIVVLLAASLAVPAYLWVTRGRGLPLRVVLDPPTHLVKAGGTVPLGLRILPPSAAREVQLSWEGEGIRADGETWQAPKEPGTYTVKVKARRSGTMVKDSVSFHVSRDPGALRMVRPPTLKPRPKGLAPCDGPAPEVKLETETCAGGNVVLSVSADRPVEAWHALDGDGGTWSARGTRAELVLPRREPWPTVVSLVAPLRAGGISAPPERPSGARGTEIGEAPRAGAERPKTLACAWTIRTPLSGATCRAGPGAGVFADFTWQLRSPGQFSFAAKPARHGGPRLNRYRWDFGDGTKKTTRRPQTSHRYKPPLRRYWLVKLEVSSAAGEAKTTRLVVDRTVGDYVK